MSDSEEPIIYEDHPDWQDGDFTLNSSDGCRFKVPSHVLFHARCAEAPKEEKWEVIAGQ